MPLTTDSSLASLLRTSHVVTTTAIAYDSSTGAEYTIPVVGGRVSVDATRSVRRSLTLQTVDIDGTLTPTSDNRVLTPYGTEIRVWRNTIDPATGVTYSVQQGVFVITGVSLTATDDAGVRIDIKADDRAYLVSSSRLAKTLTLTTGKKISEAIAQVLDASPVSANYDRSRLATTSYTIDTKYVQTGDDPWQVITGLAMAAGQMAYFDVYGRVVTASIPSMDDLLAYSDWSYVEDSSNTVVEVSRDFDSDGVVNGVIVIGAGSDFAAAVRGETYDTFLGSPTSSNTVYGKRPTRVDSSYIRSAAQAQFVAESMLPLYVGQKVDFSMVPNPAMDVHDIVEIESTRLGFRTNVLVDSIDLPLEPSGTMRVTGRSRTI